MALPRSAGTRNAFSLCMKSTALSGQDLDAYVHGGLRIQDIQLEGTPPPFGSGATASGRWADLQAAQYLARDPGIGTVTYETPRGAGPFILGSYSQSGLEQDLRSGVFQMNEGVPRDALDRATQRADDLHDAATTTHQQILDRQDPNDEGYGFFDQQHRADQAYAELQPLRDEYHQGRYVTPGPNYDSPSSSYELGRQGTEPAQQMEAPAEPTTEPTEPTEPVEAPPEQYSEESGF